MNLLAQDKVAEARARLQQALQARHFVTALKRPRLLVNLTVGLLFLGSTYLGLGSFVGHQVRRAYARRNAWRRAAV